MQVNMEQIVQTISDNLPVPFGKRFIAAIDGRCASGKTTLAQKLQERFGCTVFHMDDYFLRPEQRTETRLGNVDHERFEEEILRPLKKGEPQISYRPYDCHVQKLLPPVTVSVSPFTVVEGSYCCHLALWEFYDLHIFLTVDPEKQLERIKARNADSVTMFEERWIPLEEQYFKAASVQSKCELCFET